MKPFAVFKNGNFNKFHLNSTQKNARFRVDMWLKLNHGETIKHEITTKETVSFHDLLTHTITPQIDELLAEASAPVQSYGFNCYKWG